MATNDTEPTTVFRQRTFNGQPVDVEKAAETNGNAVASAGQRSQLTTGPLRQFEELEAGLNRFWNRFTRKGKKNVPVVASLRAIAFSSSYDFVASADLRSTLRAQPIRHLYTLSVDWTFLEKDRREWKDRAGVQ
ncbi:hypothetical protein H0H87_011780 [Tephrocybe sp. NHM501043]|nr:hypothetical protein H0H87_011780 [Tephrocybe sp. NHM501043]